MAHIHAETKGHLDTKVLAFGPLKKNVEEAPEVVAAINAYIKAVFASRPFDDVLGRVHAELLARKGGEGLGQSFTPGDLLDLVLPDQIAALRRGAVDARAPLLPQPAASQQQAVAMGFRAMQFNLVVASNVRAVRLWQHLGFAIVGTLPGAFRHHTLGYVDAHVMFKTLVA